MGRTIYFYAATSALFCCFAFCFYLLAFCFEKNQMFGLDITNDKDLPAFKELRKNIIKRLLVITGFYLLPTLFFICCFGEQNKAYPLIPLFLMISSYALFFLNSKSKVILMQNKMFVPEKEKDFISFVFSVIFALPSAWYLAAGALANTVLFLVVSIPMADGRQAKKEGFPEYKRQTRMLLPIKK